MTENKDKATVVVEVRCRKGHRRVVLPGQMGPTSFPMCDGSEDRCYGPMFPVKARPQRTADRVYRNGSPQMSELLINPSRSRSAIASTPSGARPRPGTGGVDGVAGRPVPPPGSSGDPHNEAPPRVPDTQGGGRPNATGHEGR